ncbi:hypothetical protein RGAI101_3191 [Roseobacter sp. GAI101]|nr:hypothetical protein RGAI101_3191 [Roseobacter sp. GAI101]
MFRYSKFDYRGKTTLAKDAIWKVASADTPADRLPCVAERRAFENDPLRIAPHSP